jgi:hypothetical protein
MLKAHIGNITRIVGGYDFEILEFNIGFGNNKDSGPQFAFKFSMRTSDAMALADAIKNTKGQKVKQLTVEQQQEIKSSPQPVNISNLPPTVPQSTPPPHIYMTRPHTDPADIKPVSRPGMVPKGTGPAPVIGGRKQPQE